MKIKNIRNFEVLVEKPRVLYADSETIDLKHRDGTRFVKMNTKWTQKGRLFLYNILKDNGIVPMIEM